MISDVPREKLSPAPWRTERECSREFESRPIGDTVKDYAQPQRRVLNIIAKKFRKVLSLIVLKMLNRIETLEIRKYTFVLVIGR